MTLFLLLGVENGQTVRMPVGKKEIFITFRVRLWAQVSVFTKKSFINSQTVVNLFWFEMCSVLAPRSRKVQCSGGTEQTSTLTFMSLWHKRSLEEQPGHRVFMRLWIYQYVSARLCLVTYSVEDVSEVYFKVLGRPCLQIPAGIQTDQRICLTGKGIARVSGYGFGDHYVHVKVKIPK